MKIRSLFTKFLLMQALYTAIYTSFSSFVVAYLGDARSLSDSQSSLLLMLFTAGAFTGEFVFSRLCDRLHTHKRVFLLCCFLIAPVAIALYLCPMFPFICVLYFLLGFCETPLFVVLDTWFLDSFPGDTGLYGKVLAGGAISYAVLSFSYGRLLDMVGYGIMPFCLVGVLILTVLLALTIPDASSAASAESEAQGSLRRLLTIPFVLLLLALLGTGICCNTYSLLPVLMDHMPGGSLALLGLAMSSSGVCQIPFMLITGRIKRIPARYRIALAGVIYFVMILCFALGDSPWHLIFGAAISGASWGLLLPGYRELVHELAAPDVRTTAQGLADAATGSVGGVLSSGFVSLTSASLGLKTPLLMISILQAGAIIVIVLTEMRLQHKNNPNPSHA